MQRVSHFSQLLEWIRILSIIFGASVILIYTLLGGFWAVSVSDSIQGVMMALSAIILPCYSRIQKAGISNVLY